VLKDLQNSLNKLETAFTANPMSVREDANLVLVALKNLEKSKLGFKEDKVLKNIVAQIDRLSIQNEFKLNLIKDFSEYYNKKK